MAITSSLGVKNIGESVRSLGIAVTRVKRSAITSSNILQSRTKVKKSSIFEGRRLFQRKRESIRRKDQENMIELSTLTTPIQKGTAAIARSTQGFLGRIMEFAATLITGWLLYNLPTLIAMAKELMGRITRMVEILRGFIGNLGNIMTGFGNVLGAVFQDIISLDFLDTSKRVKNAMNDLTGTFDDMHNQIDEGLRLLTTSLGEGLVTGENAPPTGTQYPAQPEAGAPTPSGGSPDFWTLTAVVSLEDGDPQGRADVAQSIYNRAASGVFGTSSIKGIILSGNGQQYEPVGRAVKQFKAIQNREDAIKAVMVANKLSRSQAEKMIDDTVSAITNPNLQKKAAEFVENRTDFLGVGLTPDKPSSTPLRRRKPSDNIFGNYVGPGSYQYGLKSQGQASAANLQLPNVESPTPAKISPTQGVSTSVVDQFKGKPGGSAGIITSERGMRDGRMHRGIDIAPAGPGYYVALKISGTVSVASIGYNGGFGNYVDIKSGNIVYRFAHLARIFVRRGQSYNGQTIGEIGSTGRSTGPHLHYEVLVNGKDINPRPYLGLLSIGRQLTGTAGQPAQVATPTPTPAQIAAQPQQRRQQLPGQITPERQGPQIVLIDDVQPQQPSIPMGGGGGGGIIPIVINPLNRYITNKLLLDLAYT